MLRCYRTVVFRQRLPAISNGRSTDHRQHDGRSREYVLPVAGQGVAPTQRMDLVLVGITTRTGSWMKWAEVLSMGPHNWVWPALKFVLMFSPSEKPHFGPGVTT